MNQIKTHSLPIVLDRPTFFNSLRWCAFTDNKKCSVLHIVVAREFYKRLN